MMGKRDWQLSPSLVLLTVLTLLSITMLLFTAGCGNDTDPSNVPGDPVTEPISESATEPEEGPAAVQSFSFLFFSDTQPDPETGDFTNIGLMVAEAVALTGKPEAIIFGGDSVNHGGDETEWAGFWQALNGALDSLTTAAVAGNHDNHALLAGQFDLPDTAPVNPGEGWFYSFSAGPVFFIMLDSNIMGAANQADIDWLRAELQSETAVAADWRIAVMHHPMWPLSDIPRDLQRAETMRENFLPVLEEYGIDLILCGHQHVYARTQPMTKGSASKSEVGIIQVMVASGDKASYAVDEKDFLEVRAEAPNYVRLGVTKDSLGVLALDSEHKTIDSFVIIK